ncbi:MAG: glycosyltransferase, partial [Gammaproteobacteria bacterium]|nr:glycosyltransferase [Gammaproteobacteria bacterium]
LKIPKISIITVVLNGEKYLKKAILSVIQQKYTNLEYIIIDGGSTDNTTSIIQSYRPYIDYWHSKPDKGGNDAYNLGLQHTTGDIIAFLNADDWYEPGILEKVARTFLDNKQPDVISCNTQIINSLKKNKLYQGKQLDLTLKNTLFGLPLLNARFFKREFLHRIGIFNSHDSHANYLISADRDFLIRLI